MRWALLALALAGCGEITYHAAPGARMGFEQAQAQCRYETDQQSNGAPMSECLATKGWLVD